MKTKIPKRLMFVGWSWIIYSSLLLIDALIDAAAYLQKRDSIKRTFDNPPPELAKLLGMMSIIYQNIELILIIRIILSIAGILIAIQFLRLRSKARLALECLSWVMVSYFAAYMIFLFSMISSITDEMGSASNAIQETYKPLVIVFVFGAPFILSLWQLRGSKICYFFRNITTENKA
jgi:hypothetical protein